MSPLVFSSPVSGEVIEILRGEKRKILEIKILADKETEYVTFNKADPAELKQGKHYRGIIKQRHLAIYPSTPFWYYCQSGCEA